MGTDYDALSEWAESDAPRVGRGKRVLRGEEGRALLRKVQAEPGPEDAVP